MRADERAQGNRGARIGSRLQRLIWLAPLALYAADAYAWGLYTHMYFAQLLLWAVPLADPRFRHALRRFPELCLAATCLPDVSLFSRPLRAAALRTTHQWSAAIGMLDRAGCDEERAMAIGYASHLLTDVVAHNYFVPAHEHRWLTVPIVTHAGSEWAMDAHIARALFVQPAALIARHRDPLVAWAAQCLGSDRVLTERALTCLMHGERTLRRSRLPQLAYRIVRCADRSVRERFDEYIRETSLRLRQINRLIAGDTPAWLPEVAASPHASRPAMPHNPPPRTSRLLPADFFRDHTYREDARSASRLRRG